jgi:hypothetical protein
MNNKEYKKLKLGSWNVKKAKQLRNIIKRRDKQEVLKE